jgi:hypothetical protein
MIESNAYFDETGNIGAEEKTGLDGLPQIFARPFCSGLQANLTIVLSIKYGHQVYIATYFVTVSHDLLELSVDLGSRPRQPLAVLGHLKARNGDTAAIRSLYASSISVSEVLTL